MLKSIGFFLVGVIINFIILKFGMKMMFPIVYRFKDMQDILSIPKHSVVLKNGACLLSTPKTIINASNPDNTGFIWLPDSNNLKGGAQFSYTFWIDLKANSTLVDKILFLRGSLKKDIDGSYITKCPLVKITNSEYPKFNIEFNTMNKMNNMISLDEDVFKMIQSGSSGSRWFLISITFQDYIDFKNSEHGIQCQIMINDNLVKTVVFKDDALKINNGDVIITPDDEDIDSNSSYADLTYHNYALDIFDVQSIHNKGVSDLYSCTDAKSLMTEDMQRLYQRLSTYNHLRQI
jgi:hypothetical protein